MKKRKSLIALVAALVLICSCIFTGCGGPKSLEDYVAKDADAKATIDQMATSEGLDVEIKGNDVIYTYDISNISGITEDLAKNEEMQQQLTTALDSQKGTFESLVTTLEKETKFDNVRIIVKYTYNGEEITSQTFEN